MQRNPSFHSKFSVKLGNIQKYFASKKMGSLLTFTALALVLFSFSANASAFDVNLDLIELNPIRTYVNGNSSGLTRTGSSGIGISYTFYLSDIKVNWMNAMTLCSNRGMKLLTLTTQDIDFAVRSTLNSKGSFSVWTAARDVDLSTTGRNFRWATTDEPVAYATWRYSFPTDSFNGCISAANTGACGRDGFYGWDNRDCATLLYAMCQ